LDDWELHLRPAIIRNTKYAISINNLLTPEIDADLESPPTRREYRSAVKWANLADHSHRFDFISWFRVRFTFHFMHADKVEAPLGSLVVMLSHNFDGFADLCRGFEGCKVHKIQPGVWFESCGHFPATRIPQKFLDSQSGEQPAGTFVMTLGDDGSLEKRFALTFRKMSSLGGSRVAVGRVVKGVSTLAAIESFGSRSGLPIKTIFIKKCGALK
jgi:Cyclophilin type peptidyl-prolyl cis-trans isomerase/CLD